MRETAALAAGVVAVVAMAEALMNLIVVLSHILRFFVHKI